MSLWKAALKTILIFIALFILLLAGLASYIFVDFSPNEPAIKRSPEWVNDITQLNPILVNNVFAPTTIEQIKDAIMASSGKISIGGGRFSQGGQIALEESLHLDMRNFNKVLSLDVESQEITVQSGIRWRDIQEVIDPENLSVKIMQSYANFTVGGSLSVNVHGRYMGEGPIILSVKSFKLVLADGSLVEASPQKHSEVFYGAIGGYGAFGVIVEATLALVPNTKIERHSQAMSLSDYPLFFSEKIKPNADIIFHNALIYPPEYTDLRSVSWVKTDKALTVDERLTNHHSDYWWQPKLTKFVADSDFGKYLRQYVFDPLTNHGDVVQWRNREASLNLYELEPNSRKHNSYALREYFVPVAHFNSFAENMAEIFQRYEVNVLNVSIRHALPDTGSVLAWAREEVFAFVVYYRQGTSEDDKARVKVWSQALIDAAIAEGGAYYLPYQLQASTGQFHASYPRANEFFKLKKQLDPNNRFSNKMWEQHYPSNKNAESEN
jgi:FAD/FMN-containing dehydrogenase